MNLMGLDIGTTGCKAQVINQDGKRLGFSFREYGVDTDSHGKAEQDAEAVWQAALEVIRQAASQAGSSSIGALSLSVQGDAIIPVNGNGKAIYPAILGMDYRSAAQADRCARILGDRHLFNLTGMRPHPMNSLTKILLLRDISPAVYNSASRITTYADFILGKLGAPGITDLTMASRTMAWDIEKGEWSEEILHALDVNPGLFSEVVPSGSPVGTLAPKVAEYTGMSEKVILGAGGHDQPCAALGSGVTGPGRGVASTGTAEVFSCAFKKAGNRDAFYKGFYPEYSYTLPEMRFTFSLNHVGGILLKWFRDNFCDAETRKSAETGVSAYKLLDERMPADPTKLFFLPHLNGSGTPWCDMDSRGALIGLTMNTNRHDVAKSILESLTYELAMNLETMEGAGLEVNEIIAAGGGASSLPWLHLKADILNRPVIVPKNHEAGSLGAAILAGAAAGIWDPAEAAAGIARSEKTIEPQSGRVKIYRSRLETYRLIYPALKEVNRRIAYE
ncbi:MAG: hypothetical protein DRZ90_04005 [Spirochaetes bacterium]|nr:MAG: hypothetical protein DRZ90_04005 [Spirochaetota bacterium]